MKTVYNALFVLLLLTVFSGCKEEYIGQYPVDSVAPKQVSKCAGAKYERAGCFDLHFAGRR